MTDEEMYKHHASCRPNDSNLIKKCSQCGLEEMMDEDVATLRDEFAGKAMQGVLSNSGVEYEDGDLVKLAYKIADAMMEARKHEKD